MRTVLCVQYQLLFEIQERTEPDNSGLSRVIDIVSRCLTFLNVEIAAIRQIIAHMMLISSISGWVRRSKEVEILKVLENGYCVIHVGVQRQPFYWHGGTCYCSWLTWFTLPEADVFL